MDTLLVDLVIFGVGFMVGAIYEAWQFPKTLDIDVPIQHVLFPSTRIMSRAKQICLAFNLEFHRCGNNKKRKADEKKDSLIFYHGVMWRCKTAEDFRFSLWPYNHTFDGEGFTSKMESR